MINTGRIPLVGTALQWFRQGLACTASGELEKAVACYNQVIELHATFWEVWYERGLALEELGLFAAAIASYDRALVYEPLSDAIPEIWHRRGNALQYGLGDYDAALVCYNRVLQLSPHHVMAMYHRGNVMLYGQHLPIAAISAYQMALSYQPDHALSWRNQGNALMELEHFVEAIASYDRALALNPTDPITLQARQLAAQRSGLVMRPLTTRPSWTLDSTRETWAEGESDAPLRSKSLTLETPRALQSTEPMLLVEDEMGLRELELTAEHYSVGRDPKNDICLKSQFASRFHAVFYRFERSDGTAGYRLCDGDLSGKVSTNGLLVNGQKTMQLELRSGDSIVFGPKTRAVYHINSES